jgi:hypothetical protein
MKDAAGRMRRVGLGGIERAMAVAVAVVTQ